MPSGKGESDVLCLKTRLESRVCIYATYILISGSVETVPKGGLAMFDEVLSFADSLILGYQ